ncbi:MAG: hypothetical protein J0M20_16350 [Burkholderiales bacterium]|nr:hypothetical protein [Burkholderiales bacterium]
MIKKRLQWTRAAVVAGATLLSAGAFAAPTYYQVVALNSDGTSNNLCYIFDGTKDAPTLDMGNGYVVPIRWGDNDTRKTDFMWVRGNGGISGFMMSGSFLNQRTALKAQYVGWNPEWGFISSVLTGTLTTAQACWTDQSPP